MKIKVQLPARSSFRGTTEFQTTTHFLVVHENNRLGEWIAKKFCYGQETKRMGKAQKNTVYGPIGKPVQAMWLLARALGVTRETFESRVRLHNPPRGQTSPDGRKRKDELLQSAAKGKQSATALPKMSRKENRE